MNRRPSYDGMLLTMANGIVMRVFEPPAWRLDRRLGWWFGLIVWRVLFWAWPSVTVLRKMRARGTVELTGIGKGKSPIVCRFVEEPKP